MAVVARDVFPRFECALATTPAEIKAAQQLRYRIFAGEMGAAIDGGPEGIDADEWDRHCQHLLVRDAGGQVVACTRLLDDDAARAAGGFYSEHEFALDAITGLAGRKLEIGRTCVAAEYRNGTTIAVLWSGLAELVKRHGYDYLFGCASIPLDDETAAQRMLAEIRERYMSAPDLRVRPHHPLPPRPAAAGRSRMPPLLKAYVSLGARACGAPYWDTDFHCADVFMLLNLKELHPRYARRFLGTNLGAA